MSYFKRGLVYWYDLVLDGVRVQKSLKTRNKEVAKKKHAALLMEKELSDSPALSKSLIKPILFEDFVPIFIERIKPDLRSWTFYQLRLTSTFMRFFKGKWLDKITESDVQKFKAVRLLDKNPQTGNLLTTCAINRDLSCLSTFYKHAIVLKHAVSNPVKEIKLLPEQGHDENEQFLSMEDVLKILSACYLPYVKVFVAIAAFTGARKSEIFRLQWQDINFEEKTISIHGEGRTFTKNTRNRVVPAPEPLLEILKAYPVNPNCKYVLNRENKPLKSIVNAFRTTLERTGLKRCRIHDLRHSYASNLTRAGVPGQIVQKNCGWKNISMLDRYSHIDRAIKQEMNSRFEAYINHSITPENDQKAKST